MSLECAPEEVALKTFFLGPQAENGEWVEKEIISLFRQWFEWRRSYAPDDGVAISKEDTQLIEYHQRQKQVSSYLKELERRFTDELPKFTPRFIAHMFSEISIPALFGHVLTLLHNPNNISSEVSRVGIQIEKETIQDLARMVGYHSKKSMGHFTSGGTVANYEGAVRAKSRLNTWLEIGTFAKETGLQDFQGNLWDASHMGWEKYDLLHSQINAEQFLQWRKHWTTNTVRWFKKVSTVFNHEYEGPILLLPASCHYSWPKAVQMFGDGADRYEWVELDANGRISIAALTEKINKLKKRQQPIWAIVSVAGTTELGIIDPIDQIQNVISEQAQKYHTHLWHHADAAYGGFLCSLVRPTLSKEFPTLFPLLELSQVNSITIDPHKLGYVPYSSGVILVKDKREYSYLKINAPYIQFDPKEDVGLQTLEGSRSAAGAVATWLTEKTLGLHSEGYGKILGRTIRSAQNLAKLIKESGLPISISPTIDTNVLVFTVAKNGFSLSESNQWVQKIYEQLGPAARASFIVSKTSLEVSQHSAFVKNWVQQWNGKINHERMDLIRLCLMNPFFDSIETKVSFPLEFLKSLENILSSI